VAGISKRAVAIWLVSIVAVMAIAYFSLGSVVSSIAHDAILSYVRERADEFAKSSMSSSSDLTVGDINYVVFTGSLTVDDIKIHFHDSTSASGTTIDLSIPQLSVSHLLPWDALFGKGLNIGSIILHHPDFKLTHSTTVEHVVDTSEFKLPRVPNIDSSVNALLVSMLPDNIAPLHIDEIGIEHADGKYENNQVKDQLSGGYSDLNISFKNITIADTLIERKHVLHDVDITVGTLRRMSRSKASILTSGIGIHVKNGVTSMSIDTIHIKSDSAYTYFAKNVVFSFSDRKLTLDSFALGPTQNDDDFYSTKGNPPDRFRVQGKGLAFHDLDLTSLQKGNGLLVKEVSMERVDLDIKSSRRNPNAFPGRPPMIYEIINSLPFTVNVASIRLPNVNLHFGELHKYTTAVAQMNWTDVACSITGLTNDKAMQETEPMVISAKGTFMGQATMEATITMPLNVKQYQFTAQGSASNLDAKRLNGFLKVAEKIMVTDGHLDRATFSYSVKGRKASGTLDVFYRDLRIDVLDQKTRKATFLMDVVSFAANLVAIRHNNTPDDKRKGKISYTIQPDDAIMLTIWYPLRNGLLGVIQNF